MLGLLTVRTVNVPPYIGFPLAAAAALAALWWFANRQLFHPMKYPAGWWELQQELGVEDLWITAADGVRLHGWWKAVPGARLATVCLHGNAGNVTHRAGHIFAVAEAGSSILVIDYRGYGKSAGSPSESGLYADARAAYGWLREQSWSPERIVVHGESLGTAVAVDLAVREPVAGVVLEAPFPSAGDVAGTILPLLGPLLVRSFRSIEKIGRLRAPLLVIHGSRDAIIPIELGRRLFDAAPEPKQFWAVPGAGHNDIVETAGPEYTARLARFYRSLQSR